MVEKVKGANIGSSWSQTPYILYIMINKIINSFQPAYHKPIPPLPGETRELIDFDDELVEDPTIASICGVDTIAQILEESSQKEEEDSSVDTLITM